MHVSNAALCVTIYFSPLCSVVLSDGANTYHAMLATQLNHLITNGTIRANTIVKLVKFSQHTVQDKRLLIITELQVLDQAEEKIITASKVEAKYVEVVASFICASLE
jgi:hypothetical protein